MRLRQIALVARDLDRACAQIREVLGLDYAYDDPGVGKFGLRNAVFPVGDTFLEVVSPKEEGTTAGRLLTKRGGDGGYMVILHVDDGLAAREQVGRAGARVIEQADVDGVVMTHIHPKDIGGAILSVDSMPTREDWKWGGPVWREHMKTDVCARIVGAELQGENPERMAGRWGEVLAREHERSGQGWRIPLDEGELRFVPIRDSRGEGLTVFDVAVRDPEAVRASAAARGLLDGAGQVVLCGTRVRLVAA
ncbi:VOC family protein [Phenylobacterium sp.]|uniref:VOC family protein n=1 Tax=Phenylobacterium sp. TaxID=1871053 RepID=UPI002C023D60|nr:VOC family protein [Phenylobacterium sp.]HVI32408.1 VOC family protein [Phenylobacterium sp.]